MLKLAAICIGILVLLAVPATALAQPEACGFYGLASIKGQDVENGTMIKAWIGGNVIETTQTSSLSADGNTWDYSIKITENGNEYDGEMIVFTIGPNDLRAGSAIWQAGGHDRLDLNGTEQVPLTDPEITLSPSEGIATRIWGQGSIPTKSLLLDSMINRPAPLLSITTAHSRWLWPHPIRLPEPIS